MSDQRENRDAITVLLVDDHAMVRQSLRSLLQSYSNLKVVGEASNGEEAVTLAAVLDPAVIVMDINMPKMNGIEATARITGRAPQPAIIGLSVHNGEYADAMLRAGAKACISKEAAVQFLYTTILKCADLAAR